MEAPATNKHDRANSSELVTYTYDNISRRDKFRTLKAEWHATYCEARLADDDANELFRKEDELLIRAMIAPVDDFESILDKLELFERLL